MPMFELLSLYRTHLQSSLPLFQGQLFYTRQRHLYEQPYNWKYLPLQRNGKDDYVIVIAKSPAELVKEGSSLHHCVGRMNYDQKMVREETLIFFIRRKDEPETPLATLEYSLSKKKVLQCYGDGDSNPEDAICTFVYNKWLPYANRKLNKIAA